MILSFSITAKLAKENGVADPLIAGRKTVTRRLWKDSTALKFSRAYENGSIVQAWNNAPYAKGIHIADIRLTANPYQEKLGDMPEQDLDSEGGFWDSKEAFISTVCNGKPNPNLIVWVCRFKLLRLVQ